MADIKKYERFNIKVVKRSQITGAEYNPRKISEESRKKLKRVLKKYGLVQPLVWNEQTGNMVGGHQRLNLLDDFHRGEEYELTVAAIDVPVEEEIKLNIILNNPSIQGEWDNELLAEIKVEYPEIDFMSDLGFDKIDLDYIFAESDNFELADSLFTETQEQKEVVADIEAIKQAKKEHREKVKQANNNAETHNVEHDDYYVTFIFNNNAEKWQFMENIKKARSEKYVKSSVLYDIYEGRHKIL